MKISELNALPVGMPVADLHATIIAAYEPKRGTSAHGEWVKLPLIVKDEAGDTTPVDWFSPTTENVAELKGKSVTISARKNGKGQMAGAKTSEYHGRDGLKRTVTVSGDHLALQGGSQPQSISSPPSQTSSAQVAPYAHPGSYSDTEILAAMPEWIRWIRIAMAELHPGDIAFVPDEQAVMATVNTMIIAATNGKLKLDMHKPE